MTRTLMRLVAALALAGVVAACGGGDDGTDDAVASLDEEAAADTGDEGDEGDVGDEDDQDDDGGGGGNGAPSSEEQAEFEDAMLEYAQCMRDHGIDMPDPEFDGNGGVMINGGEGPGPGPDDPEFEAADEECSPILEEARPDIELDPERQAEMLDQLTAVAECMRERGHDMPDPEVSSDGGVQMRVGGPDQGGGPPNEEFEQDLEECHDEAGIEAPNTSRSGNSEGGEA